ncbi:hypothetical protein Ancab_038864 [Ancistrocladus abbreviatus]
MAINYLNRLAANATLSLLLPAFLKLNLSYLSSHTLTESRHPFETSNSKENSLLSLFKHCSVTKDLEQLHAQIIQLGFHQNPYVAGKIIEFCTVFQWDSMDYAERIFNDLEYPDGFLWNTMIRGFGSGNQPRKAFEYYNRMRERGVRPDSFTFNFLLKVCGQFGGIVLGEQIHCSCIVHGLETFVFVSNALIHMYGRLREIEAASQLFGEMPGWDLVAWNVMIDCYVGCGRYKEALELYVDMLGRGIHPDEATIVVILSACSALGALDFGRCVHSCIANTRLLEIVSVSNSLIDMYAKCGAVEVAYEIFGQMKERNIVSWNTAISGLAMNGFGSEALKLFSKMVDEKHDKPDGVTFLAVLCACSHGGLVEEGRRYFDSMHRLYGIEPAIKHYGCMVDLLGRAGLVEEAYCLTERMPMKCNAIIWRTLLGACRVHGQLELGEQVRQHLMDLEYYSSDYALLGNMYATAGQWNEMARVRTQMRDGRAFKSEPANSYVGIHLDDY